MNNHTDDRSFEAVVPADEHGSSCLPVVAQAAVPADSCDLRRRIAEAERQVLFAINGMGWTAASRRLQALQREYKATKTHVGGNGALSSGGEASHE